MRVVAELDVLRGQLKCIFPDAHIRLAQIRDHIVVEGEARDNFQIARIIQTIQAYLLSIRGIEVQTSTGNLGSPPPAASAKPAQPPAGQGAPQLPQAVTGGAGATVTVQFQPFGVQLAFVPYILDSEVIRLAVSPTVSSIDTTLGTTLVPGGSPVPGLNVRQANTVVEMRQGQTLAASTAALSAGDTGRPLLAGRTKRTERTRSTDRAPQSRRWRNSRPALRLSGRSGGDDLRRPFGGCSNSFWGFSVEIVRGCRG